MPIIARVTDINRVHTEITNSWLGLHLVGDTAMLRVEGVTRRLFNFITILRQGYAFY